MKKYLVAFCFVLLSFLYIPKNSFAEGTFQILNLPSQVNAIVGSDFSTRIDFIYSGQYDGSLGVSVTGLNVESGVKLGEIKYGGNGVNSIWLTGVPANTFIGDNALTLVLTDKNGALLTKSFNLKIKNPTFVFTDNPSMSDISFNSLKKETRVMKYSYDGNDKVSICFHSPSEDLQIEIAGTNDPCVPATNGEVSLGLFPKKVGQYTIKAYASYAGSLETRKVFTLNIVPVMANIIPPQVKIDTIEPKETIKASVVTVTTPVQKTKIEELKPLEKEVFSPIEKQSSTTAIKASSSTTNLTPKEIKKENFFTRIWKKFFSWF